MMSVEDSSPLRLLYLPNDLVLNCLARVPIIYYRTLSLVSKRFRSLIASKELYETRTVLGRNESCLYVCLASGPSNKPHWFILCQKPTRNPKPNPNPNLNSRCFTPRFGPYKTLTNRPRKIKKEKSTDNLMVSIPTRNFSPKNWLYLIAVGSNIYMLGGFINGAATSRVFFMDCRSHTWHKAPSMRKAWSYAYASVLDGKIYVAGGSKGCKSSNLIEFFDPKTQTWEHVPNPSAEIRGRYIVKSLAIEGKLYLFGDKNVVYKPNEDKWDVVESEMRVDWDPDSYCVVDNILYYYRYGSSFKWYDSEGRSWRVLNGLNGLPKLPHPYSSIRLVNYGGKIAVLWDEDVRSIDFREKKIWCAVIALEKCNGQEIYGKVEWCDVVHTVSRSSSFLQVIVVSV